MELDERNEIIELFDLYEALLTDKQKDYFLDYYFADLSLAEIAQNYDISRNAVFDQIKRTIKILKDYEIKLSLNKKIKEIKSINLSEDLKEVIINILKE